MIKFSNFCGISATVFVTTTIILLASCSQDDDYYESDMYTLAEMETRSGGDPGGGGGNQEIQQGPLTLTLVEFEGRDPLDSLNYYYEMSNVTVTVIYNKTAINYSEIRYKEHSNKNLTDVTILTHKIRYNPSNGKLELEVRFGAHKICPNDSTNDTINLETNYYHPSIQLDSNGNLPIQN